MGFMMICVIFILGNYDINYLLNNTMKLPPLESSKWIEHNLKKMRLDKEKLSCILLKVPFCRKKNQKFFTF